MNGKIFYDSNGEPESVMLSYADYCRMQTAHDDNIPSEVAKDILLHDMHPIKAFRRWRNIKQKSLAEQVGVTNVTMNAIENGRREASLSLISKIAKVLNVKIDNLLLDDG